MFFFLFRSKKQGWPMFRYGLIIFGIGVVITVVTYSMAASHRSGGTYIVSWGPMLAGVVAMVRGLIGVSAAKRAQAQLSPGGQSYGVGQQVRRAGGALDAGAASGARCGGERNAVGQRCPRRVVSGPGQLGHRTLVGRAAVDPGEPARWRALIPVTRTVLLPDRFHEPQ